MKRICAYCGECYGYKCDKCWKAWPTPKCHDCDRIIRTDTATHGACQACNERERAKLEAHHV